MSRFFVLGGGRSPLAPASDLIPPTNSYVVVRPLMTGVGIVAALAGVPDGDESGASAHARKPALAIAAGIANNVSQARGRRARVWV